MSGGEKAAPQGPALPRADRRRARPPGRDQPHFTTGNLAARREMPVGVAGEGGIVTAVLGRTGRLASAGVLATVDRRVQVQQSAQMNAQIAAAEADARLAQSELDRAKKLVARGLHQARRTSTARPRRETPALPRFA